MAMGLPVIATNWSGSTDFLADDCSLPLRIDGLEEIQEGMGGPVGHRWAIPSLKHLRELMRWTVNNKREAQAIGRVARQRMVDRFSPEAITNTYVMPRLRDIATRLSSGSHRQSEL